MALRYGATKYRKPVRAGGYQRRDDPTRLLAEKGERAIRIAVADALKKFRKAIPIAAMAAKIRARDLMGAADLVNVTTLKHDLKPAFATIADVHRASGERAAKDINAALKLARETKRVRKDATTYSGLPQKPDRFAFDLYTDEVMEAIQGYQDAFITAMTDDVRATVYDAITAGVQAGTDPAEVASAIRDVIGLNDRQAQAVLNYRAALESNAAGSLDYALRDAGEDGTVQAALDAGVALDADTIDDLVDAYVSRSLDYRASMIAQTESNRAANLGLQDAYKQAVDDGVFPDGAVRQFWMLALDEKVCDVCQGIADDTPDGIPVGDAFESDDGDVDAPPAHVSCRCSIEMRTDLDMVAAAQADYQEVA